MGITLTDEQWQEVKAELMSDMKAVFRDVVYEIIETEVDFDDMILQMIEDKLLHKDGAVIHVDVKDLDFQFNLVD